MNKKMVFLIGLFVVLLLSVGSVSAGFFDFLNFGSSSNVNVVIENANINIIDEVEMTEDTFFEIDEPSDWVIIENLMKLTDAGARVGVPYAFVVFVSTERLLDH